MSILQLRPHHALCIQFFCGNGYSKEFTENMQCIIDIINKQTKVKVTLGKDMLCEKCPNLKNGKCVSDKKVSDYDNKVLELCRFNYGDIISAEQFFSQAKEKIIDCNKLSTVCKNCQWTQFCKI